MSYKMNINVSTQEEQNHIQEQFSDQNSPEVKGLLPFFTVASLTVSQGTVHHESLFYPCLDTVL